MAKVIGICNMHDNPHLGELTINRPIGSVSFLGRYALVDFVLSNFSNSGIDRMFVLVENGIMSIRSHLRSGQIWIRNTKTGFLALHTNENGIMNKKFNTDINNINTTVPICDIPFDYVVVSPCCFVTNMDLNPIIQHHIAKKKDITIVYSSRKDAKKEFINCDELVMDSRENVSSIKQYVGKTSTANISLETFIISRKAFEKMLSEAKEISNLFGIRQMIAYYAENKKMKIGGYRYNGYVAPILSFNHYVRHSFNLLDYTNRAKLFKPEWPIYTTTHDSKPAYYGENAEVTNSFISNGAIVKGKVENSIISRNVRIDEGATIKNSILFTGTEVGSGTNLQYVLCDKAVKVREMKKLEGESNNIFFVHQGAKI